MKALVRGLTYLSRSSFAYSQNGWSLKKGKSGISRRVPSILWLCCKDQGPTCALPGLLDAAARGAPVRLVLADAEFDFEPNHQHIRQRLGARSIIPAKRRGIPNGAIRNQMFRAFPKKPYPQRTKIETVFSVVKRKLSSRALGVAGARRFARPCYSALPTISIA